jgi:hypothetical protein
MVRKALSNGPVISDGRSWKTVSVQLLICQKMGCLYSSFIVQVTSHVCNHSNFNFNLNNGIINIIVLVSIFSPR